MEEEKKQYGIENMKKCKWQFYANIILHEIYSVCRSKKTNYCSAICEYEIK